MNPQGLSAGLLRQATYTTARLGIHAKIVDYLKEANKGAPLPLAQKAGAGLAAGGLGAMFGSPADLSLIRMQADKTLPVNERRNYTGVVHALSDIVKKEGVSGLFTGAGTTSIRAMALNMGMLASNDQAKEMMKENNITGFPATLGASAIAGFFASFFSLPFDYVKTQLPQATRSSPQELRGIVLHVEKNGSLVTNIHANDINAVRHEVGAQVPFRAVVGDHSVPVVGRWQEGAPEVVAVYSATGYLTLVAAKAEATAKLGVQRGAAVAVAFG